MLPEDKYFNTLSEKELWQRYCGFLDLSMEEFLNIQKELLLDKMELVANSVLGQKIMKGAVPHSVDEFRSMVPLTTYADYEPYLSERNEDVLAAKPHFWCHSAGRRGEFKWVPQSREGVDKASKYYLGGIIMATTSQKGKINISPGMKLLTIVAPPPYTSGSVVRALAERFSVKIIPPLEGSENESFKARIIKGFKTSMKEGVDVIGALASVLVKMGEALQERENSRKPSLSYLHPGLMMRLLRAWWRSKREKRKILPKDIWGAKGILVGGLDTEIYKDAVKHFWGAQPYEFYAGTEGLHYAMPAWTRKGMIFLPDMMYLEFIPYEIISKQGVDSNDKNLRTILLDEVEEGKMYELVMTQFYGMPLLRYRTNDIVKFITLGDHEAGIKLPSMTIQRRIDEVITLAGLAKLDEKTIWKAINNSGIKYNEWMAIREYSNNQINMRLYLEMKSKQDVEELAQLIDKQLKEIDVDYKDIEAYLDYQPIRVTILQPGTFLRFTEEKEREGVNIAHLKPPHVNAPDDVVQAVLKISKEL